MGATGKVAACILIAAACGGEPPHEPPARILAGPLDTVHVNMRRPGRLRVPVLGRAGRALPDTSVRFAWASGDAIGVSARGDVTCARQGDAMVRATVGTLTTHFPLRCRPVEFLRFPGPIQLVVGDTVRPIPVVAYGPDGRPTDIYGARVAVGDSSLVALDGLHVRPLRPGATTLTVAVGNRQATTGLHVYAPVPTLDGLKAERKLVAVPLRLAPGEMRRWPLPWGGWMLSMWPAQGDTGGLQLRIEGARCKPAPQISDRRYLCTVNGEASVIVYAPWRAGAAPELTGMLAVKPSG